MNLLHHMATRNMDPDDRAEYDRATALAAVRQPADAVVEPDAPSWWHGDEEATASTLAAASTFGRR